MRRTAWRRMEVDMRVEGELRADVAGLFNLGTPGAIPAYVTELSYSLPRTILCSLNSTFHHLTTDVNVQRACERRKTARGGQRAQPGAGTGRVPASFINLPHAPLVRPPPNHHSVSTSIMFARIAARRAPELRTVARRAYTTGRSEGSVAESKGFRCVVSALRLSGWLTVL